MAEYKRFIAYFYEYIDGRKQKNAGFAKVELRNGVWRILFRLTADIMPERPIEVFGFVRRGEYLLGIPMGSIRPGREIVEEWAYQADTPVGKGYLLEDFSGIWIQSKDDRKFLTVWDDEEIQINRFVLELPADRIPERTEKKDLKAAELSGEQEVIIKAETENEDDRETEKAGEVQAGIESNAVKAEKEEKQEKTEICKKTEGDGEKEEVCEEPEKEAERKEACEGTKRGMEKKEVCEETERGGAKEKSCEEAKGDGENVAGKYCEVKTEREKLVGEEMDAAGGREVIAAECCAGSQTEENSEKKEKIFPGADQKMKQGTLQQLFSRRPGFQPFLQDDETRCIMIRPCDVAWLQQKGWKTGRSSFIQYGFYQYRHLLLGMNQDGKCILGVPGIQMPQEKYLAEMFGYGDFRISRICENGREFGYWCREMN